MQILGHFFDRKYAGEGFDGAFGWVQDGSLWARRRRVRRVWSAEISEEGTRLSIALFKPRIVLVFRCRAMCCKVLILC